MMKYFAVASGNHVRRPEALIDQAEFAEIFAGGNIRKYQPLAVDRVLPRYFQLAGNHKKHPISRFVFFHHHITFGIFAQGAASKNALNQRVRLFTEQRDKLQFSIFDRHGITRKNAGQPEQRDNGVGAPRL